MLQHLSIKNYALIEHLDITFSNGFSSITGETGAGKSIILGALNLLLGQRADKSVLKDNTKKSVIEGVFDVADYQLEPIFASLDLDYDNETIFRREILPSGKTRAFINDVPVTLVTLRQVAMKLIDIHSQDNTQSLNDKTFQLEVVDALADNSIQKQAYLVVYNEWKALKKNLQLLEQENNKNKSDLDYFSFQLDQLDEAKLQVGELQDLEQEQETMQHAEDIQGAFFNIYNSVESEGSVLDMLNAALQTADKSAVHNVSLQELTTRLKSIVIDLRDVASEAQTLSDELEFSPSRMEEVNERLSLIYELQQKHHLDTVEDLLLLQQELEAKVESIRSFDDNILGLKKEITAKETLLTEYGGDITQSRRLAFDPVIDFISERLRLLGMPNASLKIACEPLPDFSASGVDDVFFLFTANKNVSLQEIGKVASGGEKSRLMFTVKLLMAKKEVLPTILFDEIDTGVSGEVARKMGMMMREMGQEMQVISITHLPQVASCALQQYKVYKYDDADSTLTQIKQLSEEQRLDEIARLLSGNKHSEAALQNAKELLAI